MMYEGLVKSLRYCATHDCCGEGEREAGCAAPYSLRKDCDTCNQVLQAQAADAIEELSMKLHGDEAAIAGMKREIERMVRAEKPGWVSVTERLPDAYEDVLLQFPNNQAAGFCDRDGCWGVYSGDGFYAEVADNEPKPTHWAKKLPEPPKEET